MSADAKLRMLLPLAIGTLLAGSPASAAPPSLDSAFHAAYPATAPSSTVLLAGVELKRLATLPGLQVSARSERLASDGGVLLSLADGTGRVRMMVHIAVLPDAAAARRVLDAELHGVSTQLASAADPALGDLAWADDGGKGTSLVIATQANIAYSVNIVDPLPATPTAAAVAALLRKAMPVGAPAFPAATVTLPASIDAKARGGGLIQVAAAGRPYSLRADGGYVASGPNGSVVRPLAPGAVTVYATVVDELARVTVAAATTLAK